MRLKFVLFLRFRVGSLFCSGFAGLSARKVMMLTKRQSGVVLSELYRNVTGETVCGPQRTANPGADCE